MLHTILFCISLNLPAQPEQTPEEFIQEMIEYSKKIMPAVITMEKKIQIMPIIDDPQKAFDQAKKQIRQRRNRDVDETNLNEMAQKKAKLLAEGQILAMIYKYKCFDFMNFFIATYDTFTDIPQDQKCLHVQVYRDQYQGVYQLIEEFSDSKLSISPRNERFRWLIHLFIYEKIYNIYKSCNLQLDKKDQHHILTLRTKNQIDYKLMFDTNHPYIPHIYEVQNGEKWHELFEFLDFRSIDGVTIPFRIEYKKYELPPLTSKQWLKIQETHTIKSFRIESNLSKADIDAEVPSTVSIVNEITNQNLQLPTKEISFIRISNIAEEILNK